MNRLLALAPAPTDFGHVPAIPADRLTTLVAGLTRFGGAELVRGALLVGGAPPFRRDLPLALVIHPGKTAPAG